MKLKDIENILDFSEGWPTPSQSEEHDSVFMNHQ